MIRLRLCVAFVALMAPVAGAHAAPCDLAGTKQTPGLAAEASADGATLTWQGEGGANLRAQFAVTDGHPVIRELAAQEQGGSWVTLARNVTPDFQVTTAKRRLSTAQLNQMKQFHDDNPSEIQRRQWNAFWDDPLVVPGGGTNSAFLPRKSEEVRHDGAAFHTAVCRVASEGARESVSFDGLSLGIFAGEVRFTVYRGSNLLRQEAVAKTDAPDVAYVYKAGLKGFAIGDNTKVVWRDTARAWQKYEFGGAINKDPVALRARNRLVILDQGLSQGQGSLAVFPAPHKFFFARENEVNLGYVYYRKDSAGSFSLGAMQPERSEGYHPWGVSDAVWQRRTGVSHEQWENYALYNAPPGTQQRMAVYYYLSGKRPEATQAAVLAYTHNDVYKPVAGFKVLTGHYHLDLNEMLTDQGSLDYQPQWVPVFRGLGINMVYLGDFHDDSHGNDPGPIRFKEQKVYFEGAQHLSDKDFLVMPAEEPNAFLGGHWYLLTPKPVYFSHATKPPADQPFIENDPTYGQVYHLRSSKDVLEMVNREGGLIWTAHPRTKNSEEYPDRYKDQDFFQSDRFLGASWESLPADLSEPRLCAVRCFGTGDDMSNWAPKPKFLIAEGDTYSKWPDDETYPLLAVNYLKLDHVPRYDESWAPITEGLRAGNFFGTTGEVLFHSWGVSGSGKSRTYNAEIEYTYPLEFAELVWSDGKKVDRKIIDLKDTQPFGSHSFAIPFDAAGKKWVRFAVWDSAGNGAYVQPIALK
jgi:hypothetical protein